MENKINIENCYHKPVMAAQCIDALDIKPNGVYADVTFGGGGHSNLIIKKLGKNGHLFAFDQDKDAEKNKIDSKNFTFFRTNFRFFHNFLRLANCDKIDGIIADLGVSSHHFDSPERGFSFRFDSQLDMRMNQDTKISAADVLNSYSQQQLKNIFEQYGEIKNAWKLSQNIVEYRKNNFIKTPNDFINAAGNCIAKNQENKYLAMVFQALRIEVNQEIEVLKKFLESTANALKPNGRLVIMTYHSLEDRPVKNFIKAGNFNGIETKDVYGNVIAPFRALNRKVITPNQEELQENSRSRSAKLRIAVRTEYN